MWFNIWHSADDTPVLISVLEAVRVQGVPPLFHLEGILFRVRLGWRRAMRSPVLPLFALTLIVSIIAAWHLWQVPGAMPEVYSAGQAVVRDLNTANWREKSDYLSWIWRGLWHSVVTLPGRPGGTLIVVMAACAFFMAMCLIKWTHLYNVNPFARALASVSQMFRMHDLRQRTNTREQFLATLDDVARALGPRRLTIFIDDIDRCTGEKIYEAFGVMNYLTNACDCYVVVGMDWAIVNKAIYDHLPAFFRPAEKIAPVVPQEKSVWMWTAERDALSADVSKPPPSRERTAKLWMEKLVQLSVPVPATTTEKIQANEAREQTLKNEARGRRQRLRKANFIDRLLMVIPFLTVGTAIAVFCMYMFEDLHQPYAGMAPVANFVLGATRESAPRVPQPTTSTTAQSKSDALAVAPKGKTVTGRQTIDHLSMEEPPGDRKKAAPQFKPAGKQMTTTYSPGLLAGMVFGLGGLLGSLVLVYVRFYESPKADSPAFKEAINRFTPAILGNLRTPRAHKRVQNHARFYTHMADRNAVRLSHKELNGVGDLDKREITEAIVGLTVLHIAYGAVCRDKEAKSLATCFGALPERPLDHEKLAEAMRRYIAGVRADSVERNGEENVVREEDPFFQWVADNGALLFAVLPEFEQYAGEV